MFLNQLSEVTKELFLKVCVNAAWSNGVFANEEEEMIAAYCREMNIPEIVPNHGENITSTLTLLSENASSKEKNIIILEILGLVKADGRYEENEMAFMDSLVTGLKVNEDVLNKITNLLEQYTSACNELYVTICE
jgi:uncharacterized membrane protein YebE (DUF533 family)